MIEALEFEFMRNAIYAGIIASIVCGVIGTLIVVNRLVFLSGGIAHSAYGGIGLAFFLQIPYIAGTIGFTLVAAFIIALATLKAKDRSDTIIGAVWAGGMGLGVILLDLTPGYNVDLMSYLFGSILTVPGSDLIQMSVISGIVILTVIFFYNDLLAMSYDQEFARLTGVPVNILHFLLIGMIAVSIVMFIRVAGLILIIALLTIPPSIAEKYSDSICKMMIISSISGCIFTLTGLWLSYIFNLTSGATIIMVAVAGFFICLAIEKTNLTKYMLRIFDKSYRGK